MQETKPAALILPFGGWFDVYYLLDINTAYAGSTDLSQQYTEGRSLHDLLLDMQKLNKEQRESLSKFMRFLKEQ